MLLQVFEEFLLLLLLLLFGRRLRHAGQSSHEAIVETEDVEDREAQDANRTIRMPVRAAEQLLAGVLGPGVRNGQTEDGEDRQCDDERKNVGDGIERPPATPQTSATSRSRPPS